MLCPQTFILRIRIDFCYPKVKGYSYLKVRKAYMFASLVVHTFGVCSKKYTPYVMWIRIDCMLIRIHQI